MALNMCFLHLIWGCEKRQRLLLFGRGLRECCAPRHSHIHSSCLNAPSAGFSSRRGASQPAEGIEPPTGHLRVRKLECYTTLQRQVTSQLEVKRSKFVAVAAPVLDEDAAIDFLSDVVKLQPLKGARNLGVTLHQEVARKNKTSQQNQVRDPHATHNCWAYKLGDQYRFNDDDEPGGTAGRPIHSAIVSSGLDRVMVVVIRHFGGIKLGTGGLIRAYGAVSSDCLRDAPTCMVKSKVAMGLEVPFDLLGNIYPLLQSWQVEDIKHEYDMVGDGINGINFLVDFDKVDILEQTIKISCSGRVNIKVLG